MRTKVLLPPFPCWELTSHLWTRVAPVPRVYQDQNRTAATSPRAGQGWRQTFPCDHGGPVGESQNHRARVTPDNPASQRLADPEGTLPLTSNPTPSFCSSRGSPRVHGHGAAEWQSWGTEPPQHTLMLVCPSAEESRGLGTPQPLPARLWLPGCSASCWGISSANDCRPPSWAALGSALSYIKQEV